MKIGGLSASGKKRAYNGDMKKVLIDGQIFSIHQRGGISRSFASILNEYFLAKKANAAEIEFKLGLILSRYIDTTGIKVGLRPLRAPWQKLSKLALIMNWFYLWIYRYDLVHSTYYFRRYLLRKPGTKHVVTLHDMIPEDFPQYFTTYNPHYQKIDFLKNADCIICVSKYTLERLRFHHPDLVHKARVVYPGVAFKSSMTLPSVRSNTLLYVGSRGAYKDFITLLEALPTVMSLNPELNVLAVGGNAFDTKERELIHRLGLENRIFQKNLTDEELEHQYKTCLATVITSHEEGFGLPLIESMAYGSLVVASDIAVFRETSAGGYVAFPAGDSVELARILNQVIQSPKEFELYRVKGFQIAMNYTWSNTYSSLVKIYQDLLGEK